MTTAKVFQSGNSQAVRLPKEFQFKVKEVEIFRRGDEVVLRKKRKKKSLADVVRELPTVSEDFMSEGRQQPPVQKREDF